MSSTHAIITLVCLSSLVDSRIARASDREGSNSVVVIIDGSGTFASRRDEAVERSAQLLDDLSQRQLHRWEQGTDRVTVISLDAMPEVIWEGGLRELQDQGPEAWRTRFEARTDYAHCTDVTGAFRLAATRLEGDPRDTGRYLFAFTDLVDEPPTTSIRRCTRPSNPSLPGDGFPWSELEGVDASVFWLPPNQKLAWKREVEARGQVESFHLYSESEAAQVSIRAPAPKEIERTAEDRAESRERALQAASTVGGWIGKVLLGGLVALGGLVLLAALSRRGGQVPTPAPHPTRRPPIRRHPQPQRRG